MTNTLNTQVIDQAKEMLIGVEPNDRGVLIKKYPLNDARYRELIIEWPADGRYGEHAGAGQVAFARRNDDIIEHYCFEETPEGLVAQKTDETNWDAGSDEYGSNDGQLEEVIESDQEAVNVLGDVSDEHRPADDKDMSQLLEQLQAAAASSKN